jgi:hypothetical protein
VLRNTVDAPRYVRNCALLREMEIDTVDREMNGMYGNTGIVFTSMPMSRLYNSWTTVIQ